MRSSARLTQAVLSAALAVAVIAPAEAANGPDEAGCGKAERCERWVSTYDGPAFHRDFATTLALSPDADHAYITGSTSAHGTDTLTVAVETDTGRVEWVARHESGVELDDTGGSFAVAHRSKRDVADAIAVSPDGATVYVAGGQDAHGGDADLLTIAYDATSGTELWSSSYTGGSGFDRASALAVSPDSRRLFVTGRSCSGGGSFYGPGCQRREYVTIAYRAGTGTEDWHRRFDAPGAKANEARGIAAAPDGRRVYVTGRSGANTATVAYGVKDGEKKWTAVYEGPVPHSDFCATCDFLRMSSGGASLATAPDGSKVYVAGTTCTDKDRDGDCTSYDIVTLAYGAENGDKRWVKLHGKETRTDIAAAVTVDPDGSRVFVSGTSDPESAGYVDVDPEAARFTTVAYSRKGAKEWAASLEHEGGGAVAESLAASSNGRRIFVTGRRYGTHGEDADYQTVAYEGGSGDELWTQRYGMAEGASDRAVEVTAADGMAYVTGTATNAEGNEDFGTVAYDGTSGEQVWAAPYDDSGRGADDSPSDAAVSPDGTRLFVFGASDPEGYHGYLTKGEFALASYEASSGREVWVSRFDLGSNFGGTSAGIEVDPDGDSVYAAASLVRNATAESEGDTHAVTVAYDTATGDERWIAHHYPESGDIHAGALAVGPSGDRVFVAAGDVYTMTSVVAYDADTGEKLWSTTRQEAVYYSNMAVSLDGNLVFLTGLTTDMDQGRGITAAYDADTGELVWSNEVSDFGTPALGLDPLGGRVYVSSWAEEGGLLTAAFDPATGETLWRTTHEAPEEDISVGTEVTASPDGATVYAAGYLLRSFDDSSSRDSDYVTVSYDAATGRQLWEAVYQGPRGEEDEYATGVGVAPDSRVVYVTGHSGRPYEDSRFATLAYDPETGDLLWSARYGGPLKQAGDPVLAVNPVSSEVYVSGASPGQTTSSDFTTLSYPP